MKPRSPVLGYNHNVRYASMAWHVQTEDSGVNNPHVFTHLFHEGTILASKKVDYDPTIDVTAVQKLMQTQHKTMLRELKAGTFDAKIEQRYGPIRRDVDTEKIPAQVDAATSQAYVAPPEVPTEPPTDRTHRPASLRGPSPEDERPTVPDLAPLLDPPARPPAGTPPPSRATEAPRARPSLTPSRPAITVSARSGTQHAAARSGTQVPASPPPTIGGRAAARSAPPTIGSGRGGASQPNRTAEVVVSRPSIVVGKESGNREAADFWKTERRSPPEQTFGGDLISEKSLDEVILAYLSEDAPKK